LTEKLLRHRLNEPLPGFPPEPKRFDRQIYRIKQTMSAPMPANPTILLVEDDDETRYMMRLQLEQRGYKVIEAEDGETAVDLAENLDPHIVLMDLSLPRMDGFEATKRIRANDGMAEIPVVAVTAHQETDFRQGAKESGFDAYVTKPIDFDWLCELLNGLTQ
jgi:CheY-like chemotaxis protein